jgi:hypothetical protein
LTRIYTKDNFKLNIYRLLILGHALTASCVGFGHSLNPPKDVSGKAVPGWDIRILQVRNRNITEYGAVKYFLGKRYYFNLFLHYRH